MPVPVYSFSNRPHSSGAVPSSHSGPPSPVSFSNSRPSSGTLASGNYPTVDSESELIAQRMINAVVHDLPSFLRPQPSDFLRSLNLSSHASIVVPAAQADVESANSISELGTSCPSEKSHTSTLITPILDQFIGTKSDYRGVLVPNQSEGIPSALQTPEFLQMVLAHAIYKRITAKPVKAAWPNNLTKMLEELYPEKTSYQSTSVSPQGGLVDGPLEEEELRRRAEDIMAKLDNNGDISKYDPRTCQEVLKDAKQVQRLLERFVLAEAASSRGSSEELVDLPARLNEEGHPLHRVLQTLSTRLHKEN